MKPAPESDQILLAHILECVGRIEAYTQGQRSVFFGSHMVQDAEVRNLKVLAESTQRLSEPLKAREPAVSWREIAGFRNVLANGYLGLDAEIIWSVVEQDLPGLRNAVMRMQSGLKGESSE